MTFVLAVFSAWKALLPESSMAPHPSCLKCHLLRESFPDCRIPNISHITLLLSTSTLFSFSALFFFPTELTAFQKNNVYIIHNLLIFFIVYLSPAGRKLQDSRKFVCFSHWCVPGAYEHLAHTRYSITVE